MLINDYVGAIRYKLIESDVAGPVRGEGVVGRVDEKNANGRIYTRKLWERILSDNNLQQTVTERGMVGELDHPANSELKLKEAAVVWTGLSLKENGEVRGVFEVLPTSAGKELEGLLKANVRIGASTRGEGTIHTKDGADYISEDDYSLYTIDIVGNPSTRGAYPKVVKESKDIKEGTPAMGAKERFEQLREQARKLISVGDREVSESSRESIESSIDTVVEALDRVAAEDAGLTTLTTSLASDLLETKKTLRKATPVEAKLGASMQLTERVKAEYKGLRKEAKESVELLIKENAKLKEDNGKLRRYYAVAIQEGERVMVEKREALKRYGLAVEAGQRLLDRARSQSPLRESINETARPARASMTEKQLPQRSALAPKRVAQVAEAAQPAVRSGPSAITEAASFASALVQRSSLFS